MLLYDVTQPTNVTFLFTILKKESDSLAQKSGRYNKYEKKYSRRDKYFAARCTRRSNAERLRALNIVDTRNEARFERRARCVYTEGGGEV